jgi:CRP/FNR family transcriptional regulator, cyclic AMP receptor protein
MGKQAWVGVAAPGGMSPRGPAEPAMGRRGLSLLRSVPLFAGLSGRQLRRLAAHAEEVRYGAGRVVIRQGSRGDTFFVVAEGRARVMRGTRTLGHLEAGSFFGEMSLLDGKPRSASVITETPLVTIRLSRARFNKMLVSEPVLTRAILAELAARIRGLESGAFG